MSDGPAKPTNIRWAVFGLACGTSWLLYLHRYTFAIIKPELVEEWHLDKVQLGWLDSALSLSYTLFQFPLGVASDVLGVRLMLSGLILLWCLGLGMHAWAPNPKYLWYARAVLGMGQSAVYANLSRMAQSWFPAPLRTTLQGIAGITAGRLGGMCAYLLLGTFLMGRCGLDWRSAIYVLAASGILFAVAFALFYRNSPREHPLVNASEAAQFDQPGATAGLPSSALPSTGQPRMSVSQLLRSIRPRALVNLIFLNIQTILSTLADNIYSNWIPLFLFEVHHLGPEARGTYSALPLFGGAIAGFAGGVLNDVCIARTGNRRWSRTGIAFAGKGLAAALLLIALIWYENPFVFCGFLFAVKFFGDWSLATSWGVVTDIGGRATASVFAFNNAVAGLGLIAAPPLFGYLAQHYGWPAVFLTVAATYLLCAASWLAIDCTIPMIDDA
jgi:ACS family glucarate transporter-like MFS transporter/ACS family D-galactonate transporter-like MFS transporter